MHLTATQQLLTTKLAFISRQYWPLLAYTGLSPLRPLSRSRSSFASPTLTRERHGRVPFSELAPTPLHGKAAAFGMAAELVHVDDGSRQAR
jgi:hypothetical protein